MSNTHNLLEFDLKVRNWAGSSYEDVTLVFTGDTVKDHGSIMLKNLMQMLEHRKQLAQRYLKSNDEELNRSALDAISYVNQNIKQLLAL